MEVWNYPVPKITGRSEDAALLKILFYLSLSAEDQRKLFLDTDLVTEELAIDTEEPFERAVREKLLAPELLQDLKVIDGIFLKESGKAVEENLFWDVESLEHDARWMEIRSIARRLVEKLEIKCESAIMMLEPQRLR